MSDSSPRDKRFFPRRSAEPVPVLLRQTDSAAEPFRGDVLDYSPTGLSIQVEYNFPAGTLLTVHRKSEPARSLGFPVRVEHCLSHDGLYRLGCRFTAPQHWDDLQVFG